jgi:hypothetical protein
MNWKDDEQVLQLMNMYDEHCRLARFDGTFVRDVQKYWQKWVAYASFLSLLLFNEKQLVGYITVGKKKRNEKILSVKDFCVSAKSFQQDRQERGKKKKKTNFKKLTRFHWKKRSEEL